MNKKRAKVSKTSIFLAVTSIILLVLLLVSVSGAWFTSSDSANSSTINMRFGSVDYDLTVSTTVKNGENDAQITENATVYDLIGPITEMSNENVFERTGGVKKRRVDGFNVFENSGDSLYWRLYLDGYNKALYVYGDDAPSKGEGSLCLEYRLNADNSDYGYINFYDADGTLNCVSGLYVKKARQVNYTEIVPGTAVTSSIEITNTSTIDSYYTLKGADDKYYVIDQTAHALLEVTSENAATVYAQNKSGKGALAKATSVTLQTKFTLNNWVNDGSTGLIWNAQYRTSSDGEWQTLSASVATAASAIHFGDVVDLGAYLFNQSFELRAVQADNLTSYGVGVYNMLIDSGWTTTSAVSGS